MGVKGKREIPRGLSEKARRLWRETVEGFTLRADEYTLLEAACRELDLIEQMQSAITRQGLMITGSMGQSVAHPFISEIRQHRAQLTSILRALKIPDADAPDIQAGAVSSQARAAAQSRWSQSYGSA